MSRRKFKVLDLFSGIGGLSYGFSKNGFNVTGVDKSERAGLVYQIFASPNFIHADLGIDLIEGSFDVIVGGPPCRPWSPVNLLKRSEIHRDYRLVERFMEHVATNRPRIFIMENVPSLKSDKGFETQMKRIAKLGYSVGTAFVKYSDKLERHFRLLSDGVELPPRKFETDRRCSSMGIYVLLFSTTRSTGSQNQKSNSPQFQSLYCLR